MTGQLTLPGGGTGSQAATVDEVNTAVTNAAYVEISGDNMTGDLTLGTDDKITLDATAGSASFDGDGLFNNIGDTYRNRFFGSGFTSAIDALDSDSTGMFYEIGDGGSANPPELKLNANSSSSGNALLIQRQGQTTPSVTLKYDGTAQFTGSFSAVRERTNVQAVIQAVGAGGARTAYLRLDGENSGSGNSEAIALFLNDSKQAFILSLIHI